MNKYSQIAVAAATMVTEKGLSPREGWARAAQDQFPNNPASREKACPKDTFLGLAREGRLKGIPRGYYTRSQHNRAYGVAALNCLIETPEWVHDPEGLWLQVLAKLGANAKKSHNQQMYVVIALYQAGLLCQT